jgi:hypothetical protein
VAVVEAVAATAAIVAAAGKPLLGPSQPGVVQDCATSVRLGGQCVFISEHTLGESIFRIGESIFNLLFGHLCEL